MQSVGHSRDSDHNNCDLDHKFGSSKKCGFWLQCALAGSLDHLHFSLFVFLLDYKHPVLIVFGEVDALDVDCDWDKEDVEEPDHRPVDLDDGAYLYPARVDAIGDSIGPDVDEYLGDCHLRSLFDFAHLQESQPHNETELGACSEKVESVYGLNEPDLPAGDWEIFFDGIRIFDPWIPVHNSIGGIRNESVDDDSAHKDS